MGESEHSANIMNSSGNGVGGNQLAARELKFYPSSLNIIFVDYIPSLGFVSFLWGKVLGIEPRVSSSMCSTTELLPQPFKNFYFGAGLY